MLPPIGIDMVAGGWLSLRDVMQIVIITYFPVSIQGQPMTALGGIYVKPVKLNK